MSMLALAASLPVQADDFSWQSKVDTIWPARHYRELDGELVTVGSDAHRPDWVGENFDRAREIADGFAAQAPVEIPEDVLFEDEDYEGEREEEDDEYE